MSRGQEVQWLGLMASVTKNLVGLSSVATNRVYLMTTNLSASERRHRGSASGVISITTREILNLKFV